MALTGASRLILDLSFGTPYFFALTLAGLCIEEFWIFTGNEQRSALTVTGRVIEPLMKWGRTGTFSQAFTFTRISVVE